MDKMFFSVSKLRENWKNPQKRAKYLVAAGIIGILLIFLSQFSGKPKENEQPQEEFSASAYASQLEEQLTDLISEVNGAGKTRVMVTLQNSGETLFVREERTSLDNTQSTSGDISEHETREESYVLVDGPDGRTALVRTQMEPVIRGVVVVCEGGDNSLTAARITEIVTTALAISSAKVCITKLA